MIPFDNCTLKNDEINQPNRLKCSNPTPNTIPWLLPMEWIEPGKSTILGGNKFVFYAIHTTGLIIILISITASLSVMLNVYQNFNRKKKSDFSDRFPLYISICDLLWGVSNLLGDHVVLMIYQVFPSKGIATLLAVNLFFFFGYQQLMNAGLTLSTYLKVVKHVTLQFGYLEWRLHTAVFLILISQIGMYCYLEAFGNGGFWFLIDLKTGWGIFFGAAVCATCTAHATLTLVAYRAIQNVISDHKRLFGTYVEPLPPKYSDDENKFPNSVRINSYIHQTTYSTATNCLTTFIYISICLYFPLAFIVWAGWTFAYFGYIEPFCALGVIISANSGGWVNAWGYFHNRKLKERRKTLVRNTLRPNNSSSSNV
ncbi:uncharacterized protein LOC110845534 [Folsomia candida]|uniref:Uncharacterized protein n=1 Tax=Folsomia candida TaxID=158441 RepID=A0A226EQ20_FOLCA|nr:uncharacterized protein LOC110845534 [Folsomia candida]OXA58686.1 hypothetical protein Fcan01_06478 [Folsomia candida]